MPLVVARSEGTECPEISAAVAAHYDAADGSPGADANATGVAALLEVARLFAGEPLPMSLEFVALPFGADDPVSARQHLTAAQVADSEPSMFLSLDRMGVTREGAAALMGVSDAFLLAIADDRAEYLARVFAVANARFLPDFWAWAAVVPPDRVPEALDSDHAPFWEAGIPGLVITDTGERRDERVGSGEDLPEILDPDFLANSTRAVITGLVGLGTIDSEGDGVPDVCTREP